MTGQYPVLPPEEIPTIAVGSMNDTHHEEVALVNALGVLLQQAADGDADIPAITTALDEWVAHTQSHFARENQLMQEYGFPPYAVHAQEHSTALDGLHEIQRRWKEDQDVDQLAGYVFNSWPQWFQMHVNSMDNVTAQFLSNFVE